MTKISDAANRIPRNHHERWSGSGWWIHHVSRNDAMNSPETAIAMVSAQIRTAGLIRPTVWDRAPCPAGFVVELMGRCVGAGRLCARRRSAFYDQVVPVQAEPVHV